MSAYTKVHEEWEDFPSTDTPITAAALDQIEQGIADAQDTADAAVGGGGAPTDATYLVTVANDDLSDEVVVGATPGGELGGTWASPTVDADHGGSTHAAVQAAAEATAAAALSSHEADTTNVHGITNTASLETTTGAQAKADAKVTQTITNGVTTTAPSEDAVFDALALKAPSASPTLTGTPAAPTAAQGTNTTQVATTAMVQSEVTLLAPKASPTFTGTPAAPTAAQATNTTQVATTAYVQTEVGLLVPKSLWDANTMLYATTDNTPVALTIGASRIVGRKSSGDITALTGAEAGDIIGVYAGHTPTIKGGATTVTTSSLVARYCQIGKMVHAYGKAIVSSAGAANGAITVSLPVAPSTATDVYPCGTGDIQDVSNANGRYRSLTASIVTASSSIRFFRDAVVTDVEVGANPAFTLASGDVIIWGITYEAA